MSFWLFSQIMLLYILVCNLLADNFELLWKTEIFSQILCQFPSITRESTDFDFISAARYISYLMLNSKSLFSPQIMILPEWEVGSTNSKGRRW